MVLISRCNEAIIGYPLEGDPEHITLFWGLIGRFERTLSLVGGRNEGGFVSKCLAPEENGDFVERNRSFQVLLNEIQNCTVLKNAGSSILRTWQNGGLTRWGTVM